MNGPNERKWYKALLPGMVTDVSTGSFRYEIGRTYTTGGPLVICRSGFHYCPRIVDTYKFYPPCPGTVICLVTPLGDTLEAPPETFFGRSRADKYCTDKLRVDRELTPDEIVDTVLDEINESYDDADRFESATRIHYMYDDCLSYLLSRYRQSSDYERAVLFAGAFARNEWKLRLIWTKK